jgi:hypothetical protein
MMTNIEFYQRYGRDLLIAWISMHEETSREEWLRVADFVDSPNVGREEFLVNRAKAEISLASTKERLRIYCEYEGIGGWERLWEIANG